MAHQKGMGCQLSARIFLVEIAGVFLAEVLWQHLDIPFLGLVKVLGASGSCALK